MTDDDSFQSLPEGTDLTRIDEPDRRDVMPQRIGHYRILQKLGEGGMGIVYEAEQERPVRRRVALKVIKLGMDTQQVVLRFESERQALALMDHPCIARVYDAGSTAEGRPYFAMESVRGIPITDYCRKRKLSTVQQIELFIRVCEGVQHAHQKGIIHRDIKPSNVLVRDEDGGHVPKIIDFGIAKATAQRLTERTFFTEMGQLIGTPEYMSPEQAEMSGIDIDTRTDVYQLGVLLYEILTGELPFGSGLLRREGFNEFRRRVIEEEPLRPSTCVTRHNSSGEAGGPPAGENRQRSRTLRGDLDWITMKALEKDRTRRYPSASELAMDLARYLRHEPVQAGPPSNAYRLRKFVRRHQTGVSFAAVLVVLLATFVVALALQSVRLQRANETATREADIASRVAGLMAELFQASDPGAARGREIGARELLDRGNERIRTRLKEAPTVQARLMSIMGEVYFSHGLRGEARSLLEDALELQLLHDDDELQAAATMLRLGGVLLIDGEHERARRYFTQSLEIRRRLLSDDDPLLAEAISRLAHAHTMLCQFDEAARLYAEAWANYYEHLDPDDTELATPIANRAMQAHKSGDHQAARVMLDRVLTMRRESLGVDDPKVEWTLTALGRVSQALGDYATAERSHQEALAMRRKLYASPHLKIGDSLLRLAQLSLRQGRPDDAARYHEQALEQFRGAETLESPIVLYELAAYEVARGNEEDAMRLLRRAVVDNSYRCADEVAQDADFSRLAGEPLFVDLLEAIRARERFSGELTFHQPGE